jgi:hypothetical protein
MEDSKVCNKCKETKRLCDFHKDGSKNDGLCTSCKSCKRLNAKVWRSLNLEKAREKSRVWYSENKHRPEVKKAHAINNKRWIGCNPHLNAAKEAKRRSHKLKASPPWLKPEHLAQIKRTYKLRDVISEVTGIKYHVDHIVPLQGKNVCGLHVPWNLRVIPAKDNLSKGNR